jgi:hypothetical protein
MIPKHSSWILRDFSDFLVDFARAFRALVVAKRRNEDFLLIFDCWHTDYWHTCIGTPVLAQLSHSFLSVFPASPRWPC